MTLHTSDTLTIDTPAELKAIAHPVRTQILQLLEDEPASAKRLSDVLGMTHGKVGHHLKVLERAGFIEVVEERKVRAVTERFFGLTFGKLRVTLDPDLGLDPLAFLFEQAAREAAPAATQPIDPYGRIYSVRMPEELAADFAARLVALADEFGEAACDEGPVFGLAAAVYLVEMPEESEDR